MMLSYWVLHLILGGLIMASQFKACTPTHKGNFKNSKLKPGETFFFLISLLELYAKMDSANFQLQGLLLK